MLDVHPPEHAAHSWRDFLIHIATIVVGLLIAIGLEQSVEYLHHRHELRETRDALKRERDDNIQAYALNSQGLRNNIASLINNLLVLTYIQQHPQTKRANLPGVLVWPNFAIPMSDIAWRTAQTSNIVTFMSRDEASDKATLYETFDELNNAESASWKATSDAQVFAMRDPDPTHLTGQALEDEIKLVEQALLAKYRLGIEMQGLHRFDSAFAPAPSDTDLSKISLAPPASVDLRNQLAHARSLTDDRLKATPQPSF